MPKPVRKPEDIDAARHRILDEAAEIICEQGFDNLSMRKIAARLGMTAANIYNYYNNQDELYLNIQIRGFEQFTALFRKALMSSLNPIERLDNLIRTYLDFGMNNPGYYEIMMDSNAPRYTDYVKTDLEPMARRDMDLAVELMEMTVQVLNDVAKITGAFSPEDAPYRAQWLWVTVHGMVTLRNRRIWREVESDPDATIARLARDLLRQFSS